MHFAAQGGSAEVVRLLTALEVDVNTPSQGAGVTPLIAAATFGNAESCKALLDAGADTSAKGPMGRTAKEWAEKKGFADIAAIL